MTKLPRSSERELVWTLAPDFLEAIRDEVDAAGWQGEASMEAIEVVALSVERLLTPDLVGKAAAVLLEDFEKIGSQKVSGAQAPWQDAFLAMKNDYSELGWTDWPSILYAALSALEDKS